MTQALAGREGRVLGRSLLTLANVITVAVPLAADWNDSHIFNERWPAHARFHGVTALAMSTTLSSVTIWSVWSGDSDQTRARFFAAAVPVAYWASFFLALLVPGTAVDDPPNPVGRVAGVPISLLGAAATTATAGAGWFIDRRSARLRAG
jgi:phage tail sheath gpL-like